MRRSALSKVRCGPAYAIPLPDSSVMGYAGFTCQGSHICDAQREIGIAGPETFCAFMCRSRASSYGLQQLAAKHDAAHYARHAGHELAQRVHAQHEPAQLIPA